MGRAVVAVVASALGLAVTAAPSWARASCSAGDATAGYADARRAFEDKRYEDSIAILRRVYACDANPVYLANIARAFEESNRPKEAVVAWQDYLRVTGDAEERRRVEGRISALAKNADEIDRLERARQEADDARRRAEENARLAVATAARPAAPTERRPLAAGAWIASGLGAAGLITGVVLGLDALGTHASAQKALSVDEAEKTQSRAVDEARAASWALGIGGAIAAVGLTWIAIDVLHAPSAPRAVGLVVGSGGIAVRGLLP